MHCPIGKEQCPIRNELHAVSCSRLDAVVPIYVKNIHTNARSGSGLRQNPGHYEKKTFFKARKKKSEKYVASKLEGGLSLSGRITKKITFYPPKEKKVFNCMNAFLSGPTVM